VRLSHQVVATDLESSVEEGIAKEEEEEEQKQQYFNDEDDDDNEFVQLHYYL
jgi:hypothetical protein